MRKTLRPFAALALALPLLACGPPSKHDILSKAEGITSKAALEDALGAPSERDKIGPLETWTYRAADGEVTFVITGDTVRLQTTD